MDFSSLVALLAVTSPIIVFYEKKRVVGNSLNVRNEGIACHAFTDGVFDEDPLTQQ